MIPTVGLANCPEDTPRIVRVCCPPPPGEGETWNTGTASKQSRRSDCLLVASEAVLSTETAAGKYCTRSSEERRVGKASVSTCRSREQQDHSKTKKVAQE